MRPSGVLVRALLILGYLFLYLPIAMLVLYSFNRSAAAMIWGGFSIRWYTALWQDQQILQAAWLSARIACVSATLALLLGTLVAFAQQWQGRAPRLLNNLIGLPLVLPDVVMGLSLLLLFVAMQGLLNWPARGALTIMLAHATVGMAYVMVVVRARMAQLDESLAEAAADLGADPLQVLLRITLPQLMPALIAAWLLAFTLSLDDVVIASFVSGPGASTLPMVLYASIRLGLTPKINALASLLMLLGVNTAAVAGYLTLRRSTAR